MKLWASFVSFRFVFISSSSFLSKNITNMYMTSASVQREHPKLNGLNVMYNSNYRRALVRCRATLALSVLPIAVVDVRYVCVCVCAGTEVQTHCSYASIVKTCREHIKCFFVWISISCSCVVCAYISLWVMALWDVVIWTCCMTCKTVETQPHSIWAKTENFCTRPVNCMEWFGCHKAYVPLPRQTFFFFFE